MPIVIPSDMPAFSELQKENIFIMAADRAYSQDIRPIEIVILNLMPTKVRTETQLIRLLSNSPLQVNLTLLNTKTHISKNTSKEHLQKFYKNFSEIKDNNFDGMIITGAPVETLPFQEVNYWNELTEIMEFANKKVTSTLYICWGAQAALFYNYGIEKKENENKLFGLFSNEKVVDYDPLLKGFDDAFFIPQSRYTYIPMEAIDKCNKLQPLAYSKDAGYTIVKSKDNKQIFLSGHSEYDKETLLIEYQRDLLKGLKISPPKNYYNNKNKINFCWSSTANLLFSNWLNYYVYQLTPYSF